MENFILAINVVLPIALIISLGIFLKKIKFLDSRSTTVVNKLVFKVFMGILMFVNIYAIREIDFSFEDNLKFLLYPLFFITLIFIFSWFCYNKKLPDRKEFAVTIQGIYRGNFVLFGLPMAENIYGKAGVIRVAILLAIVVPLYNIIAVVLLEYYSGKNINYKKILKSTLKNPLIIGSFLALFFMKFNINLPKPIFKTLNDLARVTTPLAFITLGASLELGNIRKNMKLLLSINIMKLIINPLITISFGKIFNFSGLELIAFLAASACPTAVASFSMAKEMNVAGDLAGEIVATTTIMSIFTIFVWVIVLKTLLWI